MPNKLLLPFYKISDLVDYLSEIDYLVTIEEDDEDYNSLSVIPNLSPITADDYQRADTGSTIVKSLKREYYLPDGIYISLGMSNYTSNYFFAKKNPDNSLGIYIAEVIWCTYSDSLIPLEETDLPELTYFFTYYDNFIENFNPNILLDFRASQIPDSSSHRNIPYLGLALSSEIDTHYYGRHWSTSPKSPYFRSCFGQELIWDRMTYPIQVFNSEGKFLSLLFNHTQNKYDPKALPKVIASTDNKFRVLQSPDSYRRIALYLSGTTCYIEDDEALEALRYLFLRYIYSNSHITKKYNYVSFSINHQRESTGERVVIIKHYAEPLNSSSITGIGEFVFNLGCKFSSLKVTSSAKTKDLESSISKWLDKFNLYSSELTVSNYLVEVKDDFLIKIASYLIQKTPLYTSF